MDDFFRANQEKLLWRKKVISHAKLEEKNADWHELADLVRKGIVHVVLACRNDATHFLDAFRFTEAESFILTRIAQQVMSPLLDQVTEKDEHGDVVTDPEFGWNQLKPKLLEDIAQNGMLLPIQLVIGLDSFRSFKYLDKYLHRI